MHRKAFPLFLLAVTILLTGATASAQARSSPPDAIPRVAAPSAWTAVGTGFAQGGKTARPGYYILTLADAPLAGYRGGVPDLAPTSPMATGTDRLDTDSPDAAAYLDYLNAVQDHTVSTIEAAVERPVNVLFRYKYATNGLAVWLTPAEAADVALLPGVIAVEPNTPQILHTDAGPRYVGAPALWDGTALGEAVGTYGEGIVVGVIDTGINMDHASFAEVDERGYEHLNPKGEFLGFCDPDHEHYDASLKCNDKLIGVYSFLTVPANNLDPEDDHGHGSHTAATAAGNFITLGRSAPTVVVPQTFSGVAPHANIVAYDACYSQGGGEGVCPPTALIKALDQAVADGVDVVNYSISSSQSSPWLDGLMLAFKGVREAGIVAAVSAGNDGPGAASARAIAPWMLSVGATTHHRFFGNTLVDLAGGAAAPPDDMDGGGLTAEFGPAPIVYAGNGDYVDLNGNTDDGGCLKRFPAGTFDGEIVVCERGGGVGRVQKGVNVQAGGAGGMVLANASAHGGALNSDSHVLPAVQITFADAERLMTWLAEGEGHTARIGGSTFAPRDEMGGVMGRFSSRGPALSSYCCRRPGVESSVPQLFDVLKPDIAAPGVDIISAVASAPGRTPPEFGSMSGTSMAAPHVAGAAALLRAARPEWRPAEIQSALMSTALSGDVRKEDGRTPAGWFDQGAGRIDVGRAAQAGLLLDITRAEMDAADPAKGGDPGALNLPSLTEAQCLADCGWRRTVTSALDRAITWTASVAGAGDLAVSVTPEQFSLEPGASQVIAIDVDASDLERGIWAFADVRLEPDDAAVPTAHMPVSVHPVDTILPPIVVAEALEPTGSVTASGLHAGTVDDVRIDVHGLAAGTRHDLSMMQDPTPNDPFDQQGGTGTHVIMLSATATAQRIVAEVTASEAPDIDLYVGRDVNDDGVPQQGETLCISGAPSWGEYCELVGSDVVAGSYWVLIQSFTGSPMQPDAVTAFTAVVESGDAGNLTVSGPDRIEPGEAFDLELAWNLPGMMPDDRWFGVVEIGTGSGTPGDLGLILVDVLGVSEAPPTGRSIFVPVARNESTD